MQTKLLENKVCLVTGAARGIGRAIAERFAKDGAIVYANDMIEGEMDQWAFEYSEKFTTKIIPVYFDICNFELTKQSIMQIVKNHTRIDVLANNAGIVSYEFLGMIDFNKFRRMFEVNVVAMINLIQLVSRLMSRKKGGSIINMSSIVGIKGAKGQLAYAATKGAVVSVTLSAAKELSEYHIRVNAVAPGMVATERFINAITNKFEDKIENIGMKRFAIPEEIADAFSFLASDRSKYITGQILGVDGGFIL
jgi:3-oxoacyl-[acyl-carrier protein] reductase